MSRSFTPPPPVPPPWPDIEGAPPHPGRGWLEYYHVDAFVIAGRPHTGNPAGVVLGADGLPDSALQAIAAENNLSETAFVLREPAPRGGWHPRSPGRGGLLRLRWFTPTVEVDLCGHATLAAAYVLFMRSSAEKGSGRKAEIETLSAKLRAAANMTDDEKKATYRALRNVSSGMQSGPIRFITRSGMLTVEKFGILGRRSISLDFPAEQMAPVDDAQDLQWLSACLGCEVKEAHTTGTGKWMAVLDSVETVRRLTPDFARLAVHASHSVIVTARGPGADRQWNTWDPESVTAVETVKKMYAAGQEEKGSSEPVPDFVSRFFGPAIGIPEDPVTGSAHCALAPHWAARLKRKTLLAEQLSARGGVLTCRVVAGEAPGKEARVKLTGTARLHARGYISTTGKFDSDDVFGVGGV